MPNTSSAKKAMRVSARRRVINLRTITKYKDAVKSVRLKLAAKNKSEAASAISSAFSQLDKAVKKNIIHKNKAARLKSRMTKAVGKMT